jgi:hypothetical protein
MPFPGVFEVDYIRVYQDPSLKQVSCDPPDMPTAAYINANPRLFDNSAGPGPAPGSTRCMPRTHRLRHTYPGSKPRAGIALR